MYKCGRPQLVGWVPPGIQEGDFQMVSSNTDYFVYCSYLSLYVMKTKDLSYSFVFSSKNIIASVCLNPRITNYIAIAFCNKRLMIIDIEKEEIITKILTNEIILSMVWSGNGETLLFHTPKDHSVSLFNINKSLLPNKIYSCETKVRYMEVFHIRTTIYLFGSSDGTLYRLSVTSNDVITQKVSLKQTIVSMILDKTTKTNFLIVTKNGSIFYYDISDSINEIHRIDSNGREFGAAAWLLDPPGHFITGDFNSGILRIWSPANDTQIESIHVYQRGLSSLLLITRTQLLCTFQDFFIAVYDLEKRQFVWSVHSGHSNTIFDLHFHPTQHDILLTAGAEGILCVWNVDSMKQLVSMQNKDENGKKLPIITSCVSPKGDYIVIGYKSGEISFASLQTYTIQSIHKISESRIISLSISSFDSDKVLAVDQSNNCFLFNKEEKAIQEKVQSSAFVLAAAFSPHEKDVFALACKDGHLDVYRKSFCQTFTCGTLDFVALCWSPHEKNIIYTTSESGVVYKFDIATMEMSNAIIIGNHKSTTRVIMCHPSIPNLVVTGSYDGFVQIYDTAKRKCISSVLAHSSYVYGITISDENPFLLVTSGRDSTIRMWSIQQLLITQQIEMILKDGRLVFSPLHGFKSLELLLDKISNPKDKEIRQGDILVHINDRRQIETKNMTQNSMQSRESLISDAEKALLLGQTKTYCEIMFSLGEYDKALASAPAVSFEFWKELGKKIADSAKTNSEKAHYQMVNGEMNEAAKTFSFMNDFQSAMMCVAAETFPTGTITISQSMKPKGTKRTRKSQSYTINTNKPFDFNRYKVASNAAKKYSEKGEIFLEAGSYLSIGDIEQTLACLMKNSELFAALLIDMKLNLNNSVIRERFVRLVLELDPNNFKALKLLSGDSLWKVASSCYIKDSEKRSQIFREYGIDLKNKSAIDQETDIYQNIISDFKNGIYCRAATDTIECLKKLYLSDSFDFTEAQKYVEICELLPLDAIEALQSIEVRVCALYFHAYEAAWKGFRWAINYISKELNDQRANVPWISDLQKQIELLNSFAQRNEIEYHLTIVSNKVPNPITSSQKIVSFGQKYQYDDLLLSREHVLQWLNLTTFSLKNDGKRFFI